MRMTCFFFFFCFLFRLSYLAWREGVSFWFPVMFFWYVYLRLDKLPWPPSPSCYDRKRKRGVVYMNPSAWMFRFVLTHKVRRFLISFVQFWDRVDQWRLFLLFYFPRAALEKSILQTSSPSTCLDVRIEEENKTKDYRRKRQKSRARRESLSLACSGCYKPEGRDRKREEKKKDKEWMNK